MTSAGVLTAPVAAAGGPAAPSTGLRQRLLRGDDTLSQFVRFLLSGGGANVGYAAVFWALGSMGTQSANLVAVVVSTALANELHRRLTFRAGDRVGWAAAQWAGSGVAVVGLVTSSLALTLLDRLTGGAGTLLQLAAVALVNGAVGLVRFVALRWVLAPRAA